MHSPLDSVDLFEGDESIVSCESREKWKSMARMGLLAFYEQDPLVFKRRVQRGLPQSFRWEVWQILSATHGKALAPSWDPARDNERSKFADLIEIDIPRTFPDLATFDHRAQRQLFAILDRYASLNPKIGYCQGMNFVAGFLLLVSNFHVEETFQVFCNILNGFSLCGLFADKLPLLSECVKAVNELAHDRLPNLKQHFEKEGVIYPMFLHQWFLTLFITALPLKTAAVIWDGLLSDRPISLLVSVSMAILEGLSAHLETLDAEKTARFLKSLREPGTVDQYRIGSLLLKKARRRALPPEIADELDSFDLDRGPPPESQPFFSLAPLSLTGFATGPITRILRDFSQAAETLLLNEDQLDRPFEGARASEAGPTGSPIPSATQSHKSKEQQELPASRNHRRKARRAGAPSDGRIEIESLGQLRFDRVNRQPPSTSEDLDNLSNQAQPSLSPRSVCRDPRRISELDNLIDL